MEKEDNKFYSNINDDAFIEIIRRVCQRCTLPSYYPPKLKDEVTCCPYCMNEVE